MRALCLGLSLLLAACSAPAARPSGAVEFSGRVVSVHLEGGFCGLVADDGRHFEPVNLPAKFCRDDLPVRVSGTLVPKGITVRMWGKLLRIDTIRRR